MTSKRWSTTGANQSPCRKRAFANPRRAALRLAIATAARETSTPVTCAAGRSLASDRDRAAAGAEVQNTQFRIGRKMSQCAFDEQLSVGARNQHLGVDLEQQRPEFLLAANIGNGLALHASLHQLLKRPAGR
jgi:hypothetical protein